MQTPLFPCRWGGSSSPPFGIRRKSRQPSARGCLSLNETPMTQVGRLFFHPLLFWVSDNHMPPPSPAPQTLNINPPIHQPTESPQNRSGHSPIRKKKRENSLKKKKKKQKKRKISRGLLWLSKEESRVIGYRVKSDWELNIGLVV